MSSFRELQEMVDFIRPNKIKHLKDLVFAEEGKMLEFYEGLVNEDFKTEIEAKKYFYPKTKNRNTYFNRLKRELQEKLADLVLLIDHTKSPFEAPSNGYAYCAKKLALINIWFYLRPPLGGVISVAEKALRVALHFQFADMIFFISRYCFYHLNSVGDSSKSAYHEKLLKEYSALLPLETRIDIISNQTMGFAKKTAKSLSKEQEKLLLDYFQELSSIRNQYSSFRINTRGIVTQIIILSLLKKDSEKLLLLEETIKETRLYPDKYPSDYQDVFYGEAVEIYIKRKQYKNANSLFEERFSKIREGYGNWFNFKHLFLILNIHAKKYEIAYETSYTIIDHPQYKKSNTFTNQQRFHISNAYAQFLAKAGKVKGIEASGVSFSVPWFLKKVPNYKIDTGGFGFSVNIVTCIHWLIDKNYDALIEKRESLITYTSKHLKNEGAYRVRHFLKMLIVVITKDFSRVRVEAHVKDRRLLSQLKKKPLSEAKQELVLEIIPFEDLWEIVLDLLD